MSVVRAPSCAAALQTRAACERRRHPQRPATERNHRAVVARAKKSKKDVQMSEAAWFLDQFKYQQRYKADTNVFSMPTSELPGGDKLTPEGAAVGILFGLLGVWFAVVGVKLISVTWALIFTTLKYGAIAGVLVLLGILAS
jgi:hypothetical protein